MENIFLSIVNGELTEAKELMSQALEEKTKEKRKELKKSVAASCMKETLSIDDDDKDEDEHLKKFGAALDKLRAKSTEPKNGVSLRGLFPKGQKVRTTPVKKPD